jgi:hypothetical protein
MGIGAYESFQYVQELGGKISVDSEPDRGTIVTVLLPLSSTAALDLPSRSFMSTEIRGAADRRRRPGTAKADQVVARPL